MFDMQFSLRKTIRNSRCTRDEIFDVLDDQFHYEGRVSETRDSKALRVVGFNKNNMGGILYEAVAKFRARRKDDRVIVEVEITIKPSNVFWIFFALDILFICAYGAGAFGALLIGILYRMSKVWVQRLLPVASTKLLRSLPSKLLRRTISPSGPACQ